jgi:hypothetical protein
LYGLALFAFFASFLIAAKSFVFDTLPLTYNTVSELAEQIRVRVQLTASFWKHSSFQSLPVVSLASSTSIRSALLAPPPMIKGGL